MKVWFDTDQIVQLADVARSWMGTPFHHNGRVKGRGVSCQNLVAEVYRELGVFPPDFQTPQGPTGWGHTQRESLIERYMDNCEAMRQRFSSLNPEWDAPRPGDLLGFQVGTCVHHAGIMIDPMHFLHCLEHRGVQSNRIDDPTYKTRLKRIWRPMIWEADEQTTSKAPNPN